MSTKRCSACKQVLDTTLFSRKAGTVDGLQYVCKSCFSKLRKKRSLEKAEHVRALASASYVRNHETRKLARKIYRSSARGKEVTAKSIRRARELYPEKARAREVVRYALVTGDLIKEPCSVCGDVKSEAHHEDYTKPLDVVWFCRYHHMEHHGKLVVTKGSI